MANVVLPDERLPDRQMYLWPEWNDPRTALQFWDLLGTLKSFDQGIMMRFFDIITWIGQVRYVFRLLWHLNIRLHLH